MQLVLLFSIAQRRYVLDTQYVLEIIPKIHIQPIPHVPAFVLGLINFGGAPIPIVDLSMIIEGQPCQEKLHTRIVLLKHQQCEIGIVAEQVTEIRGMETEYFYDAGLKWIDLAFLGKIYNRNNETFQEFDVPKFFESMQDLLIANR